MTTGHKSGGPSLSPVRRSMSVSCQEVHVSLRVRERQWWNSRQVRYRPVLRTNCETFIRPVSLPGTRIMSQRQSLGPGLWVRNIYEMRQILVSFDEMFIVQQWLTSENNSEIRRGFVPVAWLKIYLRLRDLREATVRSDNTAPCCSFSNTLNKKLCL